MLLMKLKNISKAFADNIVLKDINLDIQENSKIGLVGINGAGKTTLAKIISKDINYDHGQIDTFNENVKVCYLKQSSEFDEKVYQQMINDETKDLKDIFKTSSLLGLKELKLWSNERLSNLSGGEKTKLSLTEVFNNTFDLLILDEPTNHLDYQGIDWLIKEINNFSKALIIISHDRYFLDQVTNEIVELEDGVVKVYPGNYTNYRTTKELNYQSDLHQYQNQKRKEREIKQEIEQLRRWSAVAHRDSTKQEGFKEYYRMKAKKMDRQVNSKIKNLEKMIDEGISKPKQESALSFEFVADSKTGKSLVNAENLTKQFKDKTLFKNSNFYLKWGEKVGLFGVNGCGKTTLIKMILGQDTDYTGRLLVSSAMKVAYLSQDIFDLDENKSLEEIIYSYDKDYQTKIRTYLASNKLDPRMIHQKIKSLSLGERTRIKLIILILQENNILILDEPTNHLDLHSREQLEKTLESYTGTIIIASHDRYLLEKITDKLLLFENEQIVRLEVGFKEYLMSQSTKSEDKKYQLLIIQNQITYILSELSKYKETDQEYINLDLKFKELIKKRNELKN